ncbi:MAG: hypothetical protein HUU34_21030 [Saprospiraceae bacterium]|nr:hypothetical protein [Saprospiraceae bacterium]
MAVLKISPPPTITVGDYRNAALRHFNTCRVLWRYINLPDNSNLKNLPEEDVLINIFYLAGYVAECAIKYRYLTNHHGLLDTDDEQTWLSINVKMNIHFDFVSQKNKTWSERIIQDLDSNANLPNYIRHLGNSSSQPILLPNEEIIKDMQMSWEPAIRYHYSNNGLSLPANKNHIESFFQATKTLLQNLSI